MVIDFSNKSILEYMTNEEFQKIQEFSKDKETPFLVIDLKKIEENYKQLAQLLPYAKIYYAVKANPHPEILKLLADMGSYFDIASIYELDEVLKIGVSPDRISYGNTIKKEEDIKYAYEKGVRLFATDSSSDVKKLAENAPGSKVFFRILVEGGEADWPLSKKFGAHPDMIYHLIIKAKNLGLTPYGISFHVGSQQRDVGQWDSAISQCKYLFDAAKSEGIQLKLLNLGGGFPTQYLIPTNKLPVYTTEITRRLKEDFGEEFPEIMVEPGRYMVGDAGTIVTKIILISKKSVLNQYEWIYLDCGVYNGLMETLDESIKYPIFTEKENSAGKKEYVLAGPTCDSFDTLYQNFKYLLPSNLKDGDKLYFLTTGAYTSTYSTIAFNGFPPLKVYVLK